jgi:hypothetical protein
MLLDVVFIGFGWVVCLLFGLGDFLLNINDCEVFYGGVCGGFVG